MTQPAQEPSRILGNIILNKSEPIGGKAIGACNMEEFIRIVEGDKRILPMLVSKDFLKLIKKGMRLLVVSQDYKGVTSSLNKRHYSHVDMYSNYRDNAPKILAELETFFVSDQTDKVVVDKVEIRLNPGDYVLRIGNIVTLKNCENL